MMIKLTRIRTELAFKGPPAYVYAGSNWIAKPKSSPN